MLDPLKIRQDFPIFTHEPELVYLDSTATSLKPQSVIDKITEYYTHYSANVHRGIYKISERATTEYEASRIAVAEFINASKPDEIIFTRNATESFNLVAYAWGRQNIGQEDEILTTAMEHHSNFVPWQQLALENQALLKIIDIDDQGFLEKLHHDPHMKETLHKTIKHNTKILAISYVSNVLGTINPLKKIIQYAKQLNPKIVVIVDGCQAVPHMPIDVQDLGCDFFAFSAHKMLGPTGVGVLWGKLELLKEMFPFMMGGEMVAEVAFDHTEFKAPPHKFEAGTPNIADVIAIKEAISYIQRIGFEKIHEHEQELTEIAMKELYETFKDRIRIYGPKEPSDRAAILAFTLNDCHPHDIAQILDEENIAVRAGHHCAMPLHKRLNIPASTRLSMYMYNTHDDVFKFIERLKTAEKLLVK